MSVLVTLVCTYMLTLIISIPSYSPLPQPPTDPGLVTAVVLNCSDAQVLDLFPTAIAVHFLLPVSSFMPR